MRKQKKKQPAHAPIKFKRFIFRFLGAERHPRVLNDSLQLNILNLNTSHWTEIYRFSSLPNYTYAFCPKRFLLNCLLDNSHNKILLIFFYLSFFPCDFHSLLIILCMLICLQKYSFVYRILIWVSLVLFFSSRFRAHLLLDANERLF